MECDELAANLTDFLEGELDAAFEAAAVEHLATCVACESVLAGTGSVIGLAPAAGRVEVPPALRESLLASVVADLERGASGERER